MTKTWDNVPEKNFLAEIKDSGEAKNYKVAGRVRLFTEGGVVPGIPTKVSQLENDANYQNYSQVDNLIKGAIGDVSSMKLLTAEDYDWPENSPDGIAMWRLEPGAYYTQRMTKLYRSQNTAHIDETILFVGSPNENYYGMKGILYQQASNLFTGYVRSDTAPSDNPDNYHNLRITIKDNLYTDSANMALSANQGKVLDEKINKSLETIPFNYPEEEPDGIAVWLLDDGNYFFASPDGIEKIKIYLNTTGTTSAEPQYLNIYGGWIKILNFTNSTELDTVAWSMTVSHDQGNMVKLDGSYGTIQGLTHAGDGEPEYNVLLEQRELIED